jgi:hypothetical protein
MDAGIDSRFGDRAETGDDGLLVGTHHVDTRD